MLYSLVKCHTANDSIYIYICRRLYEWSSHVRNVFKIGGESFNCCKGLSSERAADVFLTEVTELVPHENGPAYSYNFIATIPTTTTKGTE